MKLLAPYLRLPHITGDPRVDVVVPLGKTYQQVGDYRITSPVGKKYILITIDVKKRLEPAGVNDFYLETIPVQLEIGDYLIVVEVLDISGGTPIRVAHSVVRVDDDVCSLDSPTYVHLESNQETGTSPHYKLFALVGITKTSSTVSNSPSTLGNTWNCELTVHDNIRGPHQVPFASHVFDFGFGTQPNLCSEGVVVLRVNPSGGAEGGEGIVRHPDADSYPLFPC